jgi:two-component system CheB/CheR fusion protein
VAKDRTSRESAARRPAADALKGVVGVGASAGGLEALQEFLGPLTPGAMAFVVAQHLAPDHPSLIVDLLSRSTELEVVEAVDGAELSAGVVAVAPPNHAVTVEGDRLRLVEPPERLGPSPSIDLLFESLAEHWGTSAIAVVLSGTGSDGARGLRAVRGGGGLTMVQSPESARFDGMPRAAMALGGVDLVADAATLGARLTVLSSGIDEAEVEPRVAQLDALPSITTQLKRSIGIDFSKYKQSTLQRQVQRRMAIRQIDDVDSYLAVLVGDADEAHALSANLLVTVTSFFRDPEAFDALRLEVARYLERPEADEVLRVWVPGCATGEEVYSIAMLVSDILGNPADLAQRLKIFGTDLDEPSLAVARRAVYPAAALARIPKHLRAAYIREAGDDFQIAEVLRECTVFARHDVGTDPPFPRIDLISCRNTINYFTAPLQQRVLAMFGFALKAGGLLVLGTAETLDRRAEGFSTVNAEWRIFTHEGNASFPYEHAPAPAVGRATKQSLAVPRQRVSPDEPNAADTALLEELVRFSGNAFLVLDERHALARVVGDVSPYCRVPEGRMTASVGSFLRPELRDEARALLLLCRTGAEPVTSQSLTLEGLDHSIHLSASRVQVGADSLTVLAFVADTDDPATRPSPESRSASASTASSCGWSATSSRVRTPFAGR